MVFFHASPIKKYDNFLWSGVQHSDILKIEVSDLIFGWSFEGVTSFPEHDKK
jgi:hypothetical protein